MAQEALGEGCGVGAAFAQSAMIRYLGEPMQNIENRAIQTTSAEKAAFDKFACATPRFS